MPGMSCDRFRFLEPDALGGCVSRPVREIRYSAEEPAAGTLDRYVAQVGERDHQGGCHQDRNFGENPGDSRPEPCPDQTEPNRTQRIMQHINRERNLTQEVGYPSAQQLRGLGFVQRQRGDQWWKQHHRYKVETQVRRETGKRRGRESLTMKGRASHIGPESCVSRREAWGEALTGVSAGQVLSHVTDSPGRRRFLRSGRQHAGGRYRQHPVGPAWSEALARRRNLLSGNREISWLAV